MAERCDLDQPEVLGLKQGVLDDQGAVPGYERSTVAARHGRAARPSVGTFVTATRA